MAKVKLTQSIDAIYYDGTNADEVVEAFPDVVSHSITVDGHSVQYGIDGNLFLLSPGSYVHADGVITPVDAQKYKVPKATK